jgi:hypothetical protein
MVSFPQGEEDGSSASLTEVLTGREQHAQLGLHILVNEVKGLVEIIQLMKEVCQAAVFGGGPAAPPWVRPAGAGSSLAWARKAPSASRDVAN